jgi:zinc protease
MLIRSIAPPIKDPVDFNIVLPPSRKITLSNGVEVYIVEADAEETVMFNWVFFAGNSYETKNTVAAATNFLLKNGTSRLTAFDINEHFDFYGAYLNRSAYNETSEITLHCLAKHTDELLPVVAEIISDSIFAEEELATYKQNSIQRLKVGLQKCDFVASRLIDATLFGEKHPYGKYSRIEDYESLQAEDLRAFYKEHYQHGKCVLFIAGKISAETLEKVEQYFGTLSLSNHRSANKGPVIAVEPSATRKQRIINDQQGVQAAIRIGRHFPNRQHPDFQKAIVLNTLFGGFFGSRLMANIREDKGYTYGIYSYMMNHIHQGGLMISTEAGRDVSEATIEEVYREMLDLREEPVDEEELQVTRSYMIGSILGDLEGPFQVMARWKNIVLHEVNEEYFYNGLEIIRKTTAQELQELANKYLVPEAFYELMVI